MLYPPFSPRVDYLVKRGKSFVKNADCPVKIKVLIDTLNNTPPIFHWMQDVGIEAPVSLFQKNNMSSV